LLRVLSIFLLVFICSLPDASGVAAVGPNYPNETPASQTLREVGQVFDKLNRLTAETSAGATHSYTYDKAGNRLTTTYGGSDRLLTSTYDKLNRLTTLAEGGTGVPPASFTTYGYDLSSNTIRKTLPNGSTTLTAFDAINRKLSETTRTTTSPTSALISSFDYSTATVGFPSGYDKVGNLLQIVEFYGRTDVKARTVTNTYDRAYRLATENLAEVSGTNNTTTYGYDKANNRTSKVVTGTNPLTETSTFGQLTDGFNSNQLKTVSRNVGVSPTSFQYDFNGNRSAKLISGATTQTYIFDPENRLTTLTDTTLGTFTYTYDHRTRRLGRNEPNTTPTEISFSGGTSVQERPTGTATPTVETIRGSDYGGGIGGVIYTIRSGISSYNAYNSRGDVVSKTNAEGTITYQASYEAYGKRTQEQGITLDRQKANTKDEDPTGLLNEQHRYRDLEFGVFLTPDPLGYVDGPNRYTYVRQNPWTKFDPLGL
jgi:RHS repeat-associated protein